MYTEAIHIISIKVSHNKHSHILFTHKVIGMVFIFVCFKSIFHGRAI